MSSSGLPEYIKGLEPGKIFRIDGKEYEKLGGGRYRLHKSTPYEPAVEQQHSYLESNPAVDFEHRGEVPNAGSGISSGPPGPTQATLAVSASRRADSNVAYPPPNDRIAQLIKPEDQPIRGPPKSRIEETVQNPKIKDPVEEESPRASRRHGSTNYARPATDAKDELLRMGPNMREEAPPGFSAARVPSRGLSSSLEAMPTSGTEACDLLRFAVLEDHAKAYTSIPHNDVEQRAAYLRGRPGLVNSRLDDFLREAVQQILNADVTGACLCVQSLVELNLCRDVKPRFFEEDLIEMHQGGTELNLKYDKNYKDVMRDAEKTAKEKAQRRAAQERRSAQQDPGYNEPLHEAKTHHARHDSRTGYTSYEPPDLEKLRMNEGNAKTERDSEVLLDNISSSQVVPVRTKNIIQIKPEQFADSGMKQLSAQYRVPGNGAKFFMTGKVFSLLWHEAAGAPRNPSGGAATDERENAGKEDQLSPDSTRLNPNVTIGPYGEKIYSHIRRMVVIKNREGYCWCIGVNSYSGQGLKKTGLRKRERDAHTIIHDSEIAAKALPDEPRTPKRPIAVKMVKGQSLTPASRLHYGKPYVVEWNTRVMDVGQVLRDDMPTLLVEAAAELLSDTSKAQKNARHEYV
ncbi:hypothetical protein LTR70_003182 [Exophiala xenobiotica]|nr:hypothetical protein LTR70_003182 [Exophiala xenobiotica]